MTKTIWYLEDCEDQFLTVQEFFSLEFESPIELIHIDTFKGLKDHMSDGELPNLLIADNQLPKANFINELGKSTGVREAYKGCPVIVFSGDSSLGPKAKKQGLHFVQKSVDHSGLVSYCTKLLEN